MTVTLIRRLCGIERVIRYRLLKSCSEEPQAFSMLLSEEELKSIVEQARRQGIHFGPDPDMKVIW